MRWLMKVQTMSAPNSPSQRKLLRVSSTGRNLWMSFLATLYPQLAELPAPTRNRRERRIDVILQEEPLPLPPGRWVGHREVEVQVDLTPSPDVNIDKAPHRHLRTQVLPELDAGEVVPQIKVGLNPHVSLVQGYEGHDVQNPQRSQMMQLQAIELQQQVEESKQRHTKSSLIEQRAHYNISHR
jgi:hypothetical protein